MLASRQPTNGSAAPNSFWNRFETVNKHTPSDIEFYAYDKWRAIARTNHLYALICLINCPLVDAPASALSSLSRASHLRGGCSEMPGRCYFDILSDAGKTKVVKSSSWCAFHALHVEEDPSTKHDCSFCEIKLPPRKWFVYKSVVYKQRWLIAARYGSNLHFLNETSWAQ